MDIARRQETTIPSCPTLELLEAQSAQTTDAIIRFFASSKGFKVLSEWEGRLIQQRDQEDSDKLQQGIAIAQEKNVIDPSFVPEAYKPIEVLGKTPDQVADEILRQVFPSMLSDDSQLAPSTSSPTQTTITSQAVTIVLVGLSGTGKGTTVERMQFKLREEMGRPVTCWSNGNLFRCVTLLATTWWEQQQQREQENEQPQSTGNVNPATTLTTTTFNEAVVLTKENIASFMRMLKFEKKNTNSAQPGVYDVHIQGLGLDLWVTDVQNTTLKTPLVSKYIPTVAQYTQGEVILFAAHAIKLLQKDGITVLVEGREQTVNYVPTPHRFVLRLSDESLIGKRRAAQRIMAKALCDYHDSKNLSIGLSHKDSEDLQPSELIALHLENALTALMREHDPNYF